MGTVYLATRADAAYEKSVAIKLVRRGMDTDFILSRFRRERQILASLEHPNIARLLDGGATDDGLPYLVMEYVKGVTITEYARDHDLSVEQRLRLFLQVFDAVEYAHGNFVVHRDLKPGNILVDEKGTPKLLDFGISKLLVFDGGGVSTETISHGMRMLTPDYASPEQIRGEPITAAADIYSLGAILFELLTDSKPHRFPDTTPQAVEQTICETAIPRPSDAARAAGRQNVWRKLHGDLDNIVLLAMRKEPKRRYASVRDFGSDIRAYLEFKPVSARSDRITYRTQKFIRRNWGAVGAIAALIVVLLAGVWMARREARIARMHFDQVRRLANTFVTDVHDEIRNLPGSTRARSMIVKTGLEYLEALSTSAQGDADLQREIGAGYMRIAEVQGAVLEANLGDPKGALNSYAKALQLLDEVARRRPEAFDVQADILKIHRSVGDINGYIKSTDAALRSYAHARAVGETLLAQHPKDVNLVRSVADVYQAQSRMFRLAEDAEAAREAASRAVELYRFVLKTSPGDAVARRDIASTLASEGMALARMHRRPEALARFEEVVRESEALLARDPENSALKRSLMLAYSHIGDIRSTPGIATPAEIADALPPFLKMYAIAEQLHKADPADYRALSDLGIAMMRVANVTPDKNEKLRRFAEALGYMNQAAKTNKDLMVQMNSAFVHTRMGDVLRERGATAEAIRHYREGMLSAEKVVSVDAKNTSSRRSLMEDLRWLGEDAARRRAWREASEYRERLVRAADDLRRQSDIPPQVQGAAAKAYVGVASILALCGEKEAARQRYESAIAEFHHLQSLPGFSYRKDLQEAENALAQLR
jgi:eukaryotic-like serine/threonine-protein kinase